MEAHLQAKMADLEARIALLENADGSSQSCSDALPAAAARPWATLCGCVSCGDAKASLERERETPQASYWRHRWKVPNSSWTLSGHSRALERTGFVVESAKAKIFLDAGVAWHSPTVRADAVLVTRALTRTVGTTERCTFSCSCF